MANDLHFGREATRELNELSECVDWKRKKGEEREKVIKEEYVLMGWMQTLNCFFIKCKMNIEEFRDVVESVVQTFRAAKDNYREIGKECICIFVNVVRNEAADVDDLLKGRAVDAVFEELKQITIKDDSIFNCLKFLLNFSKTVKEKVDDEIDEAKRKVMIVELFEKMEEEGHEDTIVSFHERLVFLNKKFYFDWKLSLDISDYFVIV